MNTKKVVSKSGRLWHLDFYCQWVDLFRKCHWYDFTIIHLAFELSPYKYSNEVSIGLLGFEFVITRCDEDEDEIKEGVMDVDEGEWIRSHTTREGEK